MAARQLGHQRAADRHRRRSSLLGIVFAEPLVRLFAAEFSDVPGKFELTVYLARIMVPFLTLVALAAVFMGMLNSLGHFFMPGAVAGDVQRRDHRDARWRSCRSRRRSASQPIVVVAIGDARRRARAARDPVAAAARAKGFRYRPSLD